MDPRQAAAERALEEVKAGMLLGLGTGSTASYFVSALGRRVSEGLKVSAVATSKATSELATSLGIRLVTSTDRPLDLTVDGADEIDPNLNLIKGLGGALLREKVVAAASLRMMVIASADKLVPQLGMRAPLPVEVLPLLWERTAAQLEELELRPALRKIR
ncbi:MAG: ribose 5-phosphate isomerase A, partial [Candidatus Dormibacteraeota bacterium]|nr:ribose 5-phosphate isomerase A [Candidatus Dormibacteraeota bacterium]